MNFYRPDPYLSTLGRSPIRRRFDRRSPIPGSTPAPACRIDRAGGPAGRSAGVRARRDRRVPGGGVVAVADVIRLLIVDDDPLVRVAAAHQTGPEQPGPDRHPRPQRRPGLQLASREGGGCDPNSHRSRKPSRPGGRCAALGRRLEDVQRIGTRRFDGGVARRKAKDDEPADHELGQR